MSKYIEETILLVIILFILFQIGDMWVNYHADINSWRDAKRVINNEFTPKYIDEGKIFKIGDRLFIEFDSEIYLLKKY